jgi:hypothetical protein
MSGIALTHAGRTDPVGIFVLEAKDKPVKLRNGDAFLLRVIE